MDEEGSNLHPNWKALATVSFKYKIFKKASETETGSEKLEEQHEIKLKDGLEAVNVYKEILEMPSTSSGSKKETSKKTKVKRKPVKKLPFDQNLLFRSATTNDPQKIQEMFNSDPSNFPINTTDQYGWTALMMAACEGAINAFVKLLELGADLNIADKQGRTARKLAEQKNHAVILEAIKDYETEDYLEISDDEDEKVVPYFCKTCQLQFNESTIKSHEASTLHLFNYKSKVKSDIKSFGISRSNRGYKMMMKWGWDQQSGLGHKSRGHLYPIKTTLRKGREGLGIQQGAAKISHFGPHDLNAVKYQTQPKVPSKKQILENYLTDKKLDRKLRQELS
jgi:hypothetical protein